ncbi:histone-lysine N-methyltransferase SETDB1-A-like isoform X2 [Amphiprion ocellaris]|uniref:histone-lysine N-methyltransferase SETDB1-A-like isoform X2 n=1 Tax=Amphiprion ocellaris TaxID=80972 RepID=UPI002411149A|nr:histone-lysine N-methyltransferase SETDB1-A-like isoform X2 [Amphiprion ocellaris]
MQRKVVMEGDVMEMSRDELQSWIRDQVKQNELISPDLLEKCSLLDLLLERRKKQVASLVELCESVAACEETVKKLYSLLGWEYSDTDSDGDEDDDDSRSTNCQTPSSPSETDDSLDYSPAKSNGPALLVPQLEDKDSLRRDNRKTTHHILIKELKVVLTRLPASTIADARPTPQRRCSEDESLSSAESDNLWEPEGDSSDSDFNISTFNAGSNKRRKINIRNGKCNRSHVAPQASTNSGTKSNRAETSTPTTTKNICAKNNVAEASTSQASASTDAKSNTTPPPEGKTDTNANSQEKKTSTVPANTKVTGGTTTTVPVQSSTAVPVQSSTTVPVQSSTTVPLMCQPATKTPPSVQPKEISVNMTVLARKKVLCWQRGTIMELITKDDKMKYKVNFEEKGKSLVSGHHVALDDMPKVDRLFVGARVIVRSQVDEAEFLPGILAEIPTRRNRMRFLVFIDDHTPMYVGLPVLRLVYKALTDPLEDIKDESHRFFMQEYMKSWPYPPQTQYKIGQTISVERNGVQQKCEVLLLDCSLIQVVFQDDQHKEWLYRGSIRLEHMVNMREHLEMKKKKTAQLMDHKD